MLEVRDFIEKMKEEVRDYLPDDVYKEIIIDDVEVVKMNDQKLHGLTFRMPGSDAAPTLYVDEMYQAYKDGADIGYLATEMSNMYSASPHVSVGHGLAVIADINMGEDKGGDWRIAINNNVLETLGVDKEKLFAQAMKNSAIAEPAMLIDMSSALFSPERVNLLDRDEPIAPEDIGGMYVLTNASGSLGAAALFYPDVKEKAAELLGSDYYILPSSVHEVILVPDAPGITEKELCDMVKEANRTVVDEKDILSDNVYHYSRGDRGLEKVTPDLERGDMVAEGR